MDVWDAAPGRPNMVATLPGSGGGRSLMFCGHTDVVGGEPSAFAPYVEDGRMHGRGTNDMKGGIAAAVVAAERLAAGPRLAGDVVLAFVIDEEWESLGAAALVERHRADGAVLPEQTDLEVDLRPRRVRLVRRDQPRTRVGRRRAAARHRRHRPGRPAALRHRRAGQRAGDAGDGRVGPPNVHASTIHGGQSYPSYPAECVIGVERCLMPGETVAQSRAEMDALLAAAAAADPRFHGELRTVIAREPVMLRRDDPVVGAMVDAARGVTGADPSSAATTAGWTPGSWSRRASPASSTGRPAPGCTRPTSGSISPRWTRA